MTHPPTQLINHSLTLSYKHTHHTYAHAYIHAHTHARAYTGTYAHHTAHTHATLEAIYNNKHCEYCSLKTDPGLMMNCTHYRNNDVLSNLLGIWNIFHICEESSFLEMLCWQHKYFFLYTVPPYQQKLVRRCALISPTRVPSFSWIGVCVRKL